MRKFGPGRTAVSYAWALSPIYTLGMGTSITMIIAAVRMRSLLLWLVQPIYLALVVLGFITAGSEDGTTGDTVFLAVFLTLVTVGTGHAFFLRRKVFSPAEADLLKQAELDVHRRRELRVRAAEVARRSPALAVEMRIGRPDLERSYDDGGLVDINHAPASVLAEIPGMTHELAERIVRIRSDTGGFISAEEVATLADLPPVLTPQIAEYGVFLR